MGNISWTFLKSAFDPQYLKNFDSTIKNSIRRIIDDYIDALDKSIEFMNRYKYVSNFKKLKFQMSSLQLRTLTDVSHIYKLFLKLKQNLGKYNSFNRILPDANDKIKKFLDDASLKKDVRKLKSQLEDLLID